MPTCRKHCLWNILVKAALAVAVLLGTQMSAPARAQGLPAAAQGKLPVTELSAGIHIIRAEVADTDATRRMGLMHRQSLPDNNGMLFVFDMPDLQCFWMRNTPLPLSIAFIADDGTIVNIADMAPQTDDAHCSARPVRYALEMAQGWFASHGIQEGNRIGGLP